MMPWRANTKSTFLPSNNVAIDDSSPRSAASEVICLAASADRPAGVRGGWMSVAMRERLGCDSVREVRISWPRKPLGGEDEEQAGGYGMRVSDVIRRANSRGPWR